MLLYVFPSSPNILGAARDLENKVAPVGKVSTALVPCQQGPRGPSP